MDAPQAASHTRGYGETAGSRPWITADPWAPDQAGAHSHLCHKAPDFLEVVCNKPSVICPPEKCFEEVTVQLDVPLPEAQCVI